MSYFTNPNIIVVECRICGTSNKVERARLDLAKCGECGDDLKHGRHEDLDDENDLLFDDEDEDVLEEEDED